MTSSIFALVVTLCHGKYQCDGCLMAAGDKGVYLIVWAD